MYVRLKDIAEKAGVSVNTVSRALRNGSDISEPVKEKIKQLAEEMGYVVNEVHEYTFKGMSKIVGIVVSSMTNPFFYITISNIIESLVGTDYCPMIIKRRDGVMSYEDLNSLMRKRVSGIISLIDIDEVVESRCKQYKIPLVMVGVPPRNRQINTVYHDDYRAGMLVAGEFFASGRKKPCYFGGYGATINENRRAGFIDTVEAKGYKCDVYDIDDRDDGLYRHIASRIIENKNDFVFGFNDEVASNLANELDAAGYTDYALYGVDGISKYMPVCRKINSVCGDYKYVADTAVKRMFELLESSDKDEYQIKNSVYQLEVVKY